MSDDKFGVRSLGDELDALKHEYSQRTGKLEGKMKDIKDNADKVHKTTVLYVLYVLYTLHMLSRDNLKQVLKILKDKESMPESIAQYFLDECKK